MAVLGQPGTLTSRPLMSGADGSWQSAKAFWFEAAGYEIHSQDVLDFHQSDARIRVPTAPARTSKSYSSGHDPLAFCFPTVPDHDVLMWMVGPNYTTNKEFDYLFDLLVDKRERFRLGGQVYEIERAVNNAKAGDMEIRLVKSRGAEGRRNRTRIKGMSATNPEALQGEQVTYANMSEAAEQDESIYTKYLQTRCWKLSMPTTPKQKAKWLQALCARGRADSRIGVESFQFDGSANPDYDWDLYEAAKIEAEMRAREELGPNATFEDDPYFAEQFMGKWVYYTGRVLPFSRLRHEVEPSRFGNMRDRRVVVSVDYGYEDAACALFWGVLPGPSYFLFDEVYERRLTTEQFVDKILEKLDSYDIKPDVFCADPSRPEVDRVMQDAGLPVFVMDKNAQRDRAAGYRRLIDALSAGPYSGFPGIYVSSKCQNTMAEWESLHYKDGFRNEYSESAIHGDDHATDAARYFLMTRPTARRVRDEPEDRVTRFLEMRRREKAAQGNGSLKHIVGASRYAA